MIKIKSFETVYQPAEKHNGGPFSCNRETKEFDVLTLENEPGLKEREVLKFYGWQPYWRETKRWFNKYRPTN